ncbi:MAG: hypothetical protein FJ221_09660 [Lentisphaerae bacterium]|nr:hypothetical protein [Lentisphaerota bacterium]
MSLRHPRAEAWEARLREVLARIDAELERDFGSRLPRHPVRPRHGATSQPESDGLFDVGAAFSAGFGSAGGPGYVVDFRIATLSRVPAALRHEIEDRAIARLRAALPAAFPGRRLEVVRDGDAWKIVGDLGLGRA